MFILLIYQLKLIQFSNCKFIILNQIKIWLCIKILYQKLLIYWSFIISIFLFIRNFVSITATSIITIFILFFF